VRSEELGSSHGCRRSSFVKASVDTRSGDPSKLEERRMVPPAGIEPATFGLQILCQNTPRGNNS
jgi:hypothetical protein